MSHVRSCHVSGCGNAATDRCFECGAWCCDEHRTAIQVPTYAQQFQEEVCAACLMLLVETPGPYGPITYERSPLGAPGKLRLGLASS